MEPRIIAGRYQVHARLGAGGMAEIFRATDRSLGRQVAVKVLHANLAHDQGFVERFRREARHAAALAHENVVAVYDTGTAEDGRPFIVMELVEGPTLAQLLRERGPLPVQQTVRIGRHVLAALQHAHERGLVHRDVKPGNILLPREGGLKVTDFGIARGLEATQALTQTGTILGTASYISPEQAAGASASAASDLYASGCVLYECLIGRPPFTGDNPVAVALRHQRDPVTPPRSLRADVPAGLDAIVVKALAKSPADRHSSADEMSRALGATGLDRAPDTAPTAVLATPSAAETVRLTGTPDAGGPTQVLPGQRRGPPPSRLGRAFGWAGIALLVGALAWLLATFATLSSPSPAPTPEPTAEPTPVVTLRPTAAPTPQPTATPEPTPTPEPEPTIELFTPEPPRTPNIPVRTPPFGGFETAEPTSSP